MSNDVLCSVCGIATRLDDVQYLNDEAVCTECQKFVDVPEVGIYGKWEE